VAKVGMLTLSHGLPAGPQAMQHPVNVFVKEYLEGLGLPVPYVHDYCQIPGRLQPAIDQLTAQGVDTVAVVFLYPPSTNRELQNPRAELGFAEPPQGWKFPFNPVKTDARILLGRTLGTHPLLVDILEERLRAVSTDPANEVAHFIIHGDQAYPSHALHEQKSEELARLLQRRGTWSEVSWSTFYPEPNTEQVCRAILERTGKKIVATTTMLEDTYFNREKLPAGLFALPEGSYAFNPEPLLPHPAVRPYLLFCLAETLREHGLADLVPDEARGVWCQRADCKLNADGRVHREERPLACLTAECGWPR
jgi:sirohydrochlorin cobaltochelatase